MLLAALEQNESAPTGALPHCIRSDLQAATWSGIGRVLALHFDAEHGRGLVDGERLVCILRYTAGLPAPASLLRLG